MTSTQEQITTKITLAALGLVAGVGTYTIAKTLFTKKEETPQEELDKHKQIEKELRRTITGFHNKKLEKHS